MDIGPVVDHDLCTVCGLCIEVCPKDVITVIDGKITVVDGNCLLCSHCYAICGADAISFDPALLRDLVFRTFHTAGVDRNKVSPEALVDFSRSRRSMRSYSDEPVPHGVLADLVEFAASAPSGSNCQNWEFTVINGRGGVFALAQKIQSFFEKLNSLVRNPVIRYLSVLVAGGKLLKYYKNNFSSVEMGLERAAAGRDPLFHGAPSLVIIHGGMEGSLPLEDGQYAAYNITLLAHAMGLGTCFIGYASETINKSSELKNYLKIPEKNRVFAVLTVGYPGLMFERPALRKNYTVSFL